MMRNEAKTINELEQEEKELLDISILKRDLLKLFTDYKSSRKGLIHFLFRDAGLTREKLTLVEMTMNFIQQYEGTKENLIEELKRRRIENSEISRQHGKYHFNLLGKRELKYSGEYSDERVIYDVKQGESGNQSGLANLFHDAIKMVSDREISRNVRNKLI